MNREEARIEVERLIFMAEAVKKCERDIFPCLSRNGIFDFHMAQVLAEGLAQKRDDYDVFFGFNPSRQGETEYRQFIQGLTDVCEEGLEINEIREGVRQLGLKMHRLDEQLMGQSVYRENRYAGI